MADLIDTVYGGRDRVIGAWLEDDLIIDPGPGVTIGRVLEDLRARGVELRAVMLTHIHLDHAGGAGALMAAFPSARLYVHEIGAPHVIDPTRLWASAGRLYGAERMEELWGEMLPVDAGRVTALRGGEEVEGLEVVATPGHAAHHVAYLDRAGGAAYVGDLAGVRVPPGEVTVMPTPPPEIDVDAWTRSIGVLSDREPELLRLTHFGEIGAAAAQLAAAGEMLTRMSERARAGEREPFMAWIEGVIADQPAEAAERMRAAMPPEQVWMGLERFWRKRRDRDQTA